MRLMADRKSNFTLRRFAAVLLGAAVLSVAGGCATQQQVKQIVDDSNARLAAAMLPDPGLAPNGKRAADAGDAARRIDDVIAAHPDQKALASSLRVRQGVIYLNEGSYNLAAAAFDSADSAQLFTDRDRALKELAPHLVWWYRTAERAPMPIAELGRAAAAMQAMKAQTAKRKDSPDVRDWIAETGAWIGLAYFAATPDATRQKSALEDAINDYSVIFTAADFAWLCTPSRADATVPLPDLRRRLRAQTIIGEAAKSAKVADRREPAHVPGSRIPGFDRAGVAESAVQGEVGRRRDHERSAPRVSLQRAYDRRESRKTLDKEPIATRAIAAVLDEFSADGSDLGITEGACGGDLLFAEALLASGAALEATAAFRRADVFVRVGGFREGAVDNARPLARAFHAGESTRESSRDARGARTDAER